MIFKMSKTVHRSRYTHVTKVQFCGVDKRVRLDPRLWQPWFAWRPVRISGGDLVWLEIVLRRRLQGYNPVDPPVRIKNGKYAGLKRPGIRYVWHYHRVVEQISVNAIGRIPELSEGMVL